MPQTHQPSFDLRKAFPELEAKNTVILHPRRIRTEEDDLVGEEAEEEELAIDGSKMGGLFYWPINEKWPRCPIDGNVMVPILQVTRRDIPELMFPGDTSLFQFFWCPTNHHKETNYGPYGKVVWRKTEDEIDENYLLKKNDIPKLSEGYDEYLIPKPCKLNPERFCEFPSLLEIEHYNFNVVKINQFIQSKSEHDSDMLDLNVNENNYNCSWSCSPSSKISGHINWITSMQYPICKVCKNPMEHLFSIASLGGYGAGASARWYPTDESFEQAINNDGININGGGMFYAFICRICPEWPIRYTSQR